MKKMRKFLSSFVAVLVVMTMVMGSVHAAESNCVFVQNTKTKNTYGFVDNETDAFEAYTDINADGISSQIYKPVSGDTLIVTFHGNGEGGVDGKCNNYSQISANRLAVTYASDEVQKAFKGAYVLAFQAPNYWYDDCTEAAMKVIEQARKEFGIDQVFVSGLSAGGLMTERMLAKYGDYFSGALFSCAAISKNNQPVEGLGGKYEYAENASDETKYFDKNLGLLKPADYDTYMKNYNEWLDSIAKSQVPIFMVHAKNDTTIWSGWTEYAYNYIKDARKKANNDTEIHYAIIDTVNYSDTTYNEHWSWIKMLNNDITASDDPSLTTLSWFESLSTSTNTYTPKAKTVESAGVSDKENTYMYNLIAEVKDSGQAIVAIEINMNDLEIDASKLSKDMFKVTAYNEDASGIITDEISSYGIFKIDDETIATADNPMEIKVANVSVNDEGNIVLELETINAVLNYTAPWLRNLATNVYYNIAPVALPLVASDDEKTPVIDKTDNEKEPVSDTNNGSKTDTVKDTNNSKDKVTPVETSDETFVLGYASLALLSLAGYVIVKRKFN